MGEIDHSWLTGEQGCGVRGPEAQKEKRKVRLSTRICPDAETVAHFFPAGDYKKIVTSRTTRYEGGGVSLVYSDRFCGQGLMNLLTNVRMEVQRNLKEDAISPVLASPQYFALGTLDKKEKAVEVDISKAYLTAAMKIGAISQATHDRLAGCAKFTRLMVIGSLATKKVISEYRDGVKVSEVQEQNQELRQVWQWIMAEVDQTMRAVAADLKKGFLYYWVDAAFVKVSHIKRAEAAMAAHGYGSKVKSMVTLHQQGRKVYVLDRVGNAPARKFPIKSAVSFGGGAHG